MSIATACETIFLLLDKRHGESVDPPWMALLMSAFALARGAPVALAQWMTDGGAGITRAELPAAAYSALVPTTLGFYLWCSGSSRVSGAQAGMFTALLPVSAWLLSAVWSKEPIAPRHWVGVSMSVLAIVVGATRASSNGAREQAPTTDFRLPTS